MEIYQKLYKYRWSLIYVLGLSMSISLSEFMTKSKPFLNKYLKYKARISIGLPFQLIAQILLLFYDMDLAISKPKILLVLFCPNHH